MPETKPGAPTRWGAVVIISLVVILIASVSVALARYQPPQPIEITLPASDVFSGNIQIGGAVTNPGIYPEIPFTTMGM